MKKKIITAFILGGITLAIPVIVYSVHFSSYGISNSPLDWTNTASYFSSSAMIVFTAINIYVIFLVSNNNEIIASDQKKITANQIKLEIFRTRLKLLTEYLSKLQSYQNAIDRIFQIKVYEEAKILMKNVGEKMLIEIVTNAKEDGELLQIQDWETAMKRTFNLISEISNYDKRKYRTDQEEREKLKNLRTEILIELNALCHGINYHRRQIMRKLESLH